MSFLTSLFVLMAILCVLIVLLIMSSLSPRLYFLGKLVRFIVNKCWNNYFIYMAFLLVFLGCIVGTFSNVRDGMRYRSRTLEEHVSLSLKADMQGRMFRSHRNAYLMGFTAFLLFMLVRLCLLEEKLQRCKCGAGVRPHNDSPPFGDSGSDDNKDKED